MMSYSTLIRLGPLVTPRAFDLVRSGAERADRFYERGALKLLPHGAPLVIDHDLAREIGRVDALLEFEDVDDLWLWARATVTDKPYWLKRGTPCSFGRYNVHVGHFGWTHAAFLREVSVLRDQTPAEPRAQVALLERAAVVPADETVIHGGAVLRRPGIGQVLGVR